MIFPKKQAQRLIPEYLLDYTEKLQTNHPDPTESWGGSGSNYTGGDGINISTENVISVDNTIAKKSEIPTNYVTLDTEQTITKSKTINAQLNFGDGTHNSILINADYANNPIISMLKDSLNGEFSIGVDDGTQTSNSGAYFTYEDDKGLREYKLPYQDATGLNKYTLATTSDIPSLDGYATQTWVQNQGYSKFSGSYNDLTDKPTFSTVATSGSYNDLLDKPTIPDTSKLVTLDTNQTITGTKTFKDGALKVENTLNCRTMTYDGFGWFDLEISNQSTIERIRFNLPTYKPKGTEDEPTQYTIATKDDIPTVNNPTITFTQGGTTKGTITLNQSGDQTIEFDAGGGGGGGGTPTNMVTTDTNQNITGEKTFVGNKRIKFKQSSQNDRLGFTGFDYDGTEIGYLEMSKRDGDFTGSPISNMLGYWSNVNSAPNPSSDVMLGFKYYTKDSDGNTRDYKLVVPPRYNEVRATRYIPISVNGNTADNTGNITVNASSTSTLTPTTETLVFTLADNSTVTVNVMTSATVETTTTLS